MACYVDLHCCELQQSSSTPVLFDQRPSTCSLSFIDGIVGEDPSAPAVVQSMIDVYSLACQLSMKRLEILCVKYLETHITLSNVLVTLTYSSQRSLHFIKVYFCATW